MTIPVGVVVACERIDHPWQEFRWRPHAVFLGAAADPDWRVLVTGDGFTHYHAATLDLELHRKETPGYKLNLESGAPAVYVVLRIGEPDARDIPITVHMATASPYDAEAHGHAGDEIIEPVAMPAELCRVVAAFVEAHHVEEPFIKRKRDGKRRDEEGELFGQEPIERVRARQHGRGGGGEGQDA